MLRISINKKEMNVSITNKMVKEIRRRTIDPICLGVGAGVIVRETVKVVTGNDTLGDALGLIVWYKTTVRRLEDANRINK